MRRLGRAKAFLASEHGQWRCTVREFGVWLASGAPASRQKPPGRPVRPVQGGALASAIGTSARSLHDYADEEVTDATGA